MGDDFVSMHRLGETRSRRTPDHLLQTPDTFVWTPLPGMKKATACVHTSPALGAGFLQYTAHLEAGGELSSVPESRFLYVLEGSLQLFRHGSAPEMLDVGTFVFLPPLTPHFIRAAEGAAMVAVIEKEYVELQAERRPRAIVAHENDMMTAPLDNDDDVRVRELLPLDTAYDFAVNILEYRPGASSRMVEAHAVEHGLLMLQGGGIYRVNDAWYSVSTGDFLWMGPFCPQWFGALGKEPARYLVYKEVNRHPVQRPR